jgi:hypothetical protein
MRKIRIDITDEHIDISELELPKTVHINAPSEREKAALEFIAKIERELSAIGYDYCHVGPVIRKIEEFKKKWGIE